MHIPNVPHWMITAFTVVVFLCALWRGGPHERLMAGFQQWSNLNAVFHLAPALFSYGLPFGVVQFAACLACTLRSRSYWTIWGSAILLVGFTTDILVLVNPTITKWAYISLQRTCFLAFNAAVFCGTLTRSEHGLQAAPIRASTAR